MSLGQVDDPDRYRDRLGLASSGAARRPKRSGFRRDGSQPGAAEKRYSTPSNESTGNT